MTVGDVAISAAEASTALTGRAVAAGVTTTGSAAGIFTGCSTAGGSIATVVGLPAGRRATKAPPKMTTPISAAAAK